MGVGEIWEKEKNGGRRKSEKNHEKWGKIVFLFFQKLLPGHLGSVWSAFGVAETVPESPNRRLRRKASQQ